MDDIYWDWNATTPPHPRVIAAMLHAAENTWGNPASVHAEGRRARAVVEELREQLGQALGFFPRDILLTSGGTEANNLALSRAAGLVTSRLEHPSVVRVAERLEALGRPVRWAPVPESGRLDPGGVAPLLAGLPEGSWLAVQAANHETGVIQPVAELASLAALYRVSVHVDAVQAFGKLAELPLAQVTSVAVAAHKIRGPKGIGALAFRGAAPPPILVGGSQERGLRPGTVDPVAASGFAVAVELAKSAPARWAELAALRDAFEQGLPPGALHNGTAERLPHVSNVSFEGVRGDELVAALDLLGVRVSSGSACSAGTTEASPVITAMLGAERARSAVRVSLGEGVSSAQVGRALQAFFTAVARTRGEPGVPREAPENH